MNKLLLVLVLTFVGFSNAFADSKNFCTVTEVTDAALNLGNSLYQGSTFDGIKIDGVDHETMGVHYVETYRLWLTSSKGSAGRQVTLEFVYRAPGNRIYGKEGCGLVTVSIPFFQAP